MKLTSEQRAALKDYFTRLGLKRPERDELFRYIRFGGTMDLPLMILGDPTTGKSTLKAILRHFGVCVYSPHESPSVTLKKRLSLDEEDSRYMRDILERLGIREKC